MSGYFDHNATTPLNDAARETWLQASATHWHNPSSLYREAGTASRLLEDARDEFAAIFDTDSARIVFNSGATEANNAVFDHVARHAAPEALAAVSAVEHPSVRAAAALRFPGRVIELPVNADGVLDLAHLETAVTRHNLALVSVMAANNESGVLQPWEEARALCLEHGIPFHCDAAQWIGKLSPKGIGECDFATASAHKFGGPKGCGLLILGSGIDDFRSQAGGPQESGRRGGTEDYPGIAATLAALRDRNAHLDRVSAAGLELRREFEIAIASAIPGTRIVALNAPRLWNTVMLILPGAENLRWLTRLSHRGFAVSTGSACSSGKGNPSPVMLAMGCDFDEMKRVIRISAGCETTAADWRALADAMIDVWKELDSPEKEHRRSRRTSLNNPDPNLFAG